jgi:hypothetical protein
MEPITPRFYHRALRALRAEDIPFLVGGAYALRAYTAVERDTKDLDVFIRRSDLDAALAVLERAGCETELTYPHWLAKAYAGPHFIDFIFNMANGTDPVDDGWFEHALESELFGQTVLFLAVEEMICSKLFTLDRGRYDGADIAHLLRASADRLDWRRVLQRTGQHWRVLLSHLVLFGYIYPGEDMRIPRSVLHDLVSRLHQEGFRPTTRARLCRGTLLSPTQYLIDVEQWGYQDARVPPWGGMTNEQVRRWTEGVQAGR